jgi:DNA repair protein RAD16
MLRLGTLSSKSSARITTYECKSHTVLLVFSLRSNTHNTLHSRLLMSLKAGGVALNLTCANYIFLMDPWWNPAAEMQAIDRTHRLGQYRPIRAVRFIAENTVEERILQLQEKKRLVFDGTVGRDAGSLKMLTVDDMKSLFA